MKLHLLRTALPVTALALLGTVAWAGPAQAIPGKPPVAADDHYDAQPGEALFVPAPGVLGNDYDPDGGTITIGMVSAATKGALDMKTSGMFFYMPPVGFVGDATFTYKAIDTTGLQSATATVTITVAAPNQLPSAESDSYSTASGVPLVVPAASGLLANDTDLDGDTLSVDDFDEPLHGSLSNDGQWDGRFTYTPDAEYAGWDVFHYKATDSHGGTTPWITVELEVIAPVADPIDLAIGNLPSGVGGATVPVTAHVTSSNITDAGVPLTLSLGGEQFTGTTGPGGDAVVPVTLPARAGRYELTGQAGAVGTSRVVTVGTAVTGRITTPTKLHRGQRLVVGGRIGTTTGHVVVTVTGPKVNRSFQGRTSATGKVAVRLPAKVAKAPGRYRVTVRYVADAQHFAIATWTRSFRSIR